MQDKLCLNSNEVPDCYFHLEPRDRSEVAWEHPHSEDFSTRPTPSYLHGVGGQTPHIPWHSVGISCSGTEVTRPRYACKTLVHANTVNLWQTRVLNKDVPKPRLRREVKIPLGPHPLHEGVPSRGVFSFPVLLLFSSEKPLLQSFMQC